MVAFIDTSQSSGYPHVGDSQLVIKQITREFKCNYSNLAEYHEKTYNCQEVLPISQLCTSLGRIVAKPMICPSMHLVIGCSPMYGSLCMRNLFKMSIGGMHNIKNLIFPFLCPFTLFPLLSSHLLIFQSLLYISSFTFSLLSLYSSILVVTLVSTCYLFFNLSIAITKSFLECLRNLH